MALVKDVNSYVTVEEADAYFADRLDVAAWMDATAIQKPQALITATSILDEESWLGVAIDEYQELAFPRNGHFDDPKFGYGYSMDPTPARITRAVFELAYHLLNNDGLLDDTGSVMNLSVGNINLSTLRSPGKLPAVVKKLISPLLVGNSSRGWWRAN
jgi:hypothetical protein